MAIFICISGWKRSGKDSAANFLVKNYDFQRLAFADTLKNNVSQQFDIPRSMIDEPSTKEAPIKTMPVEVNDAFTMTVNTFMFKEFRGEFGQIPQHYEIIGRNLYGKVNQNEPSFPLYHTPRSLCILEGSSKRCADANYWVSAALNNVSRNGAYVISDLRYKSEVFALKMNLSDDDTLVTVRINRFDSSPSNDPSERDLDDAKFDFVIENRYTIESFEEEINNMMVKIMNRME